jgi:hypothetical protein
LSQARRTRGQLILAPRDGLHGLATHQVETEPLATPRAAKLEARRQRRLARLLLRQRAMELAGWILGSWCALSIATAVAWSAFRQAVRRQEEAAAAKIASTRLWRHPADHLRTDQQRVA